MKIDPFVLQETGLRVNTVSFVLASRAAGPGRGLRAIQYPMWCHVQCLVLRELVTVFSFTLSVRACRLIGRIFMSADLRYYADSLSYISLSGLFISAGLTF